MTMIWPRPRRTIACATRRVRRKPARTLVRNIASVSSSERSRNGAYFIVPALFRKMSAPAAAAASSSTKAALSRSPATVWTCGASFFSACSSALRRRVAMTCAPARAKASAQARPIPALAPVTSTCLPSKATILPPRSRLYSLAMPLQHPVSQDVAPQLARARERQLAEALEAFGKLVVCHLPLQELDELVELELGAFLRHDTETVALPKARVGQPNHRGVQDLRVRVEDLLHLARKE